MSHLKSLRRLLTTVRIRRLFFRLVPLHYTIRPIRPALDLEALLSCAMTLSHIPQKELRARFQKEFARQDSGGWLFLIAAESQKDEKVLGFVRAMRQGRERQWWIAGLELNPLYRRRGIGTALVQGTLTSLQAAGVTEIFLAVNRNSRPAVALYEKLGFEIMPSLGAEEIYIQMRRQLGSC
jgi:ribosomal protein S18 acetylase RimI-like enzyme